MSSLRVSTCKWWFLQLIFGGESSLGVSGPDQHQERGHTPPFRLPDSFLAKVTNEYCPGRATKELGEEDGEAWKAFL